MTMLRKLGGFFGRIFVSIHEGVRNGSGAVGEFLDRARATHEPGVERMLDAGYGEHFLEALGRYRNGVRIHCDDQAVLARFGLADAPSESFETRRKSDVTGEPGVQQMLDAGYGQHFIDALRLYRAGDPIHCDDQAVLARFGLADAPTDSFETRGKIREPRERVLA